MSKLQKPENIPAVEPVITTAAIKSIGYPGSKFNNGCYHKIINQFPPHLNFVSGFLGTDAVLMHKRPAPESNVGIDLNLDKLLPFWKHRTDIEFWKDDFLKLIHQGNRPLSSTLREWNTQTLFYLDPPYRFESRKGKRKLYKFELTDEQHTQLLQWAVKVKCMVAISHYPDPVYDELLNQGWRKIEWPVRLHAGYATEALYMNYPEPTVLHQYDFLGDDKTDRQRIRRKLARLVGKLNELPAVERNAIIAKVIAMK